MGKVKKKNPSLSFSPRKPGCDNRFVKQGNQMFRISSTELIPLGLNQTHLTCRLPRSDLRCLTDGKLTGERRRRAPLPVLPLARKNRSLVPKVRSGKKNISNELPRGKIGRNNKRSVTPRGRCWFTLREHLKRVPRSGRIVGRVTAGIDGLFSVNGWTHTHPGSQT